MARTLQESLDAMHDAITPVWQARNDAHRLQQSGEHMQAALAAERCARAVKGVWHTFQESPATHRRNINVESAMYGAIAYAVQATESARLAMRAVTRGEV